MAIIKTKRNYVYAYEALDRDCWVQTLIGGGDGVRRILLTQPIDQYEEALGWAVSMADQLAYPIHVVPIDGTDFMRRHGEQLERRLAEMTPEELRMLRQKVVTTAAEVMRDCHDPEVRADAFDLLRMMGVVK
jgi:hypothetical protein